ncbi:MAG: hypothetical protein AVDCRST_MAG79-3190 [uncultured Thermoleophilia bacterium]|uniref:DUF2520 domain-containing protein n=1 Tax=uncultured Thermoleophilia bacterium TaxID=1497501 RepID=A0A6J4URV0_9ACTN|nr:MAG: hypothetical protein AVDCRST_MAG79-3190 [uncultured Thermoleophilia bacterium]
MHIAVVGPGRAGRTFHQRLIARGLEASLGRLVPPPHEAGTVILAVPDRAVAEVAAAVADEVWLGTLSGATPLAVLGPSPRRFVLHPLQTLTGAGAHELDDVPACITGAGPEAERVATDLAVRLGLRPVPVPESARPLPHVAAVLAGNALAAPLAAARRALAAAGLDEWAGELLGALAHRSVDVALAADADGRPTGPVARGDDGTVRLHLAALRRHAPELLHVYRTSALLTAALVGGPAADRVMPLLEADPPVAVPVAS